MSTIEWIGDDEPHAVSSVVFVVDERIEDSFTLPTNEIERFFQSASPRAS